MKRELAMEFSRITEAAALASYRKIGCGDKNAADDLAVKAMRYVINQSLINGEVVIGEGEMDEAPMLYIGEKVGVGGDDVDIAVDPIEGTKMVAYGQPNAIATILAVKKGHCLQAPDMYMEKFVVPLKGVIDIDKPFKDNVIALSNAIGKPLDEMVMVTLDRPRHKKVIQTAKELGVKVFLFNDGDVAESIKVFSPDSDVDFMYGIGGAPEGVISAGVARAFNGDMQARLVSYKELFPEDDNSEQLAASEFERCEKLGLKIGAPLSLDDLVSTDELVFSATGITKGDMLAGVTFKGNIATTESIIIRGKTGTIRRIISTHFIDRKDSYLYELITGKEKK